jgi:hypothetical protein
MAGLGHWYIEIEKQAYWRGQNTTWVNRYVMSGSDPAAADAATVIGALKTIEDKIHCPAGSGSGVGFVEGRAYKSSGGYPFSSVPYNISQALGTATGFGGSCYSSLTQKSFGMLESCVLIETKLNGLNSRGKPVYLRKYIRGISIGSNEGVGNVTIDGTVLSALNTAVAPWQTGMGGNSWVVIGVSGAQAASAPTAHNFLVTHQKPRGRKKAAGNSPSGLLLSIARDAAKLKQLASDIPDLP